MEPKCSQSGAQNVLKIEVSKKKCRQWFGPIIYYIYSLAAPSENLTFWHLEATKIEVFSACCLGYRPGAAKWRPRVRKMARVGSPGSTKGAKGSPNASKNAPKNNRKSAPLSRTASKGAFRVPWVPQRLQNTSISDVPPTDVTPRRGNVHLLSAIPHSLAPSHCEASLERGGLGVCPLG